VLIHDFICVEVPVEAVAALLKGGEGWLAPLALGAYAHGEALLVRAGPDDRGLLSKRVRMTVGDPRNRGDAVVVPIHWEATGVSGLFPVLDADLEFAPMGPTATQLNLWGTYDPPLEGFGGRLDRMVFHRVAEATVRAFLHRVASSVELAAGVEAGARQPRARRSRPPMARAT